MKSKKYYMLYRGEFFTLTPERKPIFIVYGSASYVADALYRAYMYNELTHEYPKVGFSILNAFKYVFWSIKELFERDERDVDLLTSEERQAARKRRRERLQSRGATHLGTGEYDS